MTENRDLRLGLVETRALADRINKLFPFAPDLLPRHAVLLSRLVVAPTTLLALGGCTGALSTVDPAGPAASVIATLWWVMLAGGVAIFVLVMALVALAFRQRREPAGAAPNERVWIVGLGIVFPAAVLAALLAYGLSVGERLLPRDGEEILKVQAEGRRHAWTFTYPDLAERATEDVLHLPAGRPVDIAITTADTIHSFWVPRLAGKLDAVPGHVNVLRIQADQPGTFAGVSAEFSGTGYEGFKFIVVAHDEAGWNAFIAGESE